MAVPYHPAHATRRERKKYARLQAFAQALPRMRQTLKRDLNLSGFPREKVLACSLRILTTCFLRPGSARYAQENGSFGVATLRRRHVSVEGEVVRLAFPGKAGKRQRREFRDKRVARIVRELLRYPGEVLKYRGEDGAWIDVRRRHINQYIKDVMGDRFTAKDFRTWSGTLICACALARREMDSPETSATRRQRIVAAVRETAERLGNTPAICRSSYIYPPLLAGFKKGKVVGGSFETVDEVLDRESPGLHRAERSLLRLLREEVSS